MNDGLNNKPDPLDNLLQFSPEEVLRTLPNDMRYKLEPLLSALGMLEDKTLMQEEHDEMIEIAKRSALAISDMLKLILKYFAARDDIQNADDKTSNNPCF